MTELLLRIFIGKRFGDDASARHAAIGSLAGAVGIVCNALLFALKLATGLVIGSVALLADAVNNLSDAASSIITLLGFRMARRPADKNHPYGHARYEYVSGFVIAILVLLIGFETAKSALDKILHPEPLAFSWAAGTVMPAAIALKLWLAAFYQKLGRRLQSAALLASAVDSRNDVIATGAVLLGCLVQSIYGVNIDGWVGLLVALFILFSGVKVARETISPLLGMRADEELIQAIRSLILSHGQVLGIHDLLVHDYGPGQYYASVHVELNADEDPMVCHDIIDDIEWDARRELNVNLVIHHDPIPVGDSELNDMRELMEEIASNIHSEISVHDFRMLRLPHQIRLVFDLEVPYALYNEQQQIKQQIDGALARTGKICKTIIHFDGKG